MFSVCQSATGACRSDATTAIPMVTAITSSDAQTGTWNTSAEQHLDAHEREHRREADLQVGEPPEEAGEEKVERAQAEDREGVRGEHQERVRA